MKDKFGWVGKPQPLLMDEESKKAREEEVEKKLECYDLINSTGIEEKFSPHTIVNALIDLMSIYCIKIPFAPAHFHALMQMMSKNYKKCWEVNGS